MKLTAKERGRMGTTMVLGSLIVLLLAFGTLALALVTTATDSQQVTSLKSKVSGLQASITAPAASGAAVTGTLPTMNQTTTVRQILETWYKNPASGQDRFEPTSLVVNQGDTVALTFVNNDTVAHDLAIGTPYNIMINATVPGLVNDLTLQTFKTNATNNSPGVVVKGTPGNVSATYTFVAKYAGVFEFFCTYHAQVGMIGYLTVLPNVAYGATVSAGHSGSAGGSTSNVQIVPGSVSNASIGNAYAPDPVTVVVGINNTIKWTNNDNAPHTVTANDASFESGSVAPGQSFTFTFTTPGTYEYHCLYHPWMTGTVRVKA
jgi:plastocyanin